MSINSKILDTVAAGATTVYFPLNNIPDSSFQITHPNTGTLIFSVSNSTETVNVSDTVQMASIGWSDLPIPLDAGGLTYTVDLTDAQFVSPWTASFSRLKFQYGRIVINTSGVVSIEQHSNSIYTKED